MMLDLPGIAVAGPALSLAFLTQALHPAAYADRHWVAPEAVPAEASAERVHRAVTRPLTAALGYDRPLRQGAVTTREGEEDGGWLAHGAGAALRVWSVVADQAAGQTHRLSPVRAAQRVLFARREAVGLLTDGRTVQVLLCDPARADSCLTLPIDAWGAGGVTDGWRLLWTLLAASRRTALPDILDAARLHQTRVTAALRAQAREAIADFIDALPDRGDTPAAALWHDALILIYRLLFILRLEAAGEQPGGFSFTAASLWRGALSPGRALAPLVRRHLDHGQETGRMLEDGLRTLFTLFRDGVRAPDLSIAPLGGGLFGADAMPHLERLTWGEHAVALLLDRLLWLPGRTRARVHYGSLDVEDLGGIYEALLELEPAFVAGRFVLRPGPGRKSSGAYYTPPEFVRFLVRQTLDPIIAERAPAGDPHPAALLAITVVDPAAGSGHFLVEACRHLAEALLTACRAADALGLTDRVAALPDGAALLPYLPSRGDNEPMARAICRRLVAVHCLYGCDRNPLAVELAKLSLWLESWAEGLPLTFLDHRLVCGDALTGPFAADLATLPVTGGPLDPLLAADVAAAIDRRVTAARAMAARLNASIGRDLPDLAAKAAAKRDLDALLAPLRLLAGAWSEAAMRGARDGDDRWIAFARQALAGDAVPETVPPETASDALPWDLTFPEVFPAGFTVVLGNPPWDTMQPDRRDFLAGDAAAPRRAADRAVQDSLLSRPEAAARFAAWRDGFARMKRIAPRLYPLQRQAAANLDLFRLFAERAPRLAAADGAIGLLLPSAFHANESTAGLRRHYLAETRIETCLSFENRRRLFAIDSRFKFDLIVARRPGPTTSMRCGFYLAGIDEADDPARLIDYDCAFLADAGGGALSFPELRGTADLRLARRLYANPERLRPWCEQRGIRFGRDLHMTGDAALFLPPGQGDLVLHEGKTFHQFTMRHDTPPRHTVRAAALRPAIAQAARHTRLVFRDIARSNDERTMIAALAPPGTVFGHTATVEKTPWRRRPEDAALLCALFNSFPFDWLIRQKAATHLSLYLLADLPLPRFTPAQAGFLATAAGAPDQAPDRDLRARMDAVVARAYGLDRAMYDRVLAGFSHRSWPEAPVACLAAFDLPEDCRSCAA